MQKWCSFLHRMARVDSTRKYPVLFFVYGEPAATTVNDAYSGASYLWYLMLAQQGYIVASIDNRGTPAPKGRAGRKALRNASGAVRVRDQSKAARTIAQRPYVDATRLGVWGWSGGGSSTLPQKRNPVLAAAAIAAATMAPNLAATIFTAQTQEHERSAGLWHAEWPTLPTLMLVTSGALAAIVDIAEGLEVDGERMRANLDSTHGLVMAEAASMALALETEAMVVKLFHLEGRSYREISSGLGIPENSIGPTLSRAREKLRQSPLGREESQLDAAK